MKMSLINLNTSQMEQILSLLEDMYYLSYPQSQQKLNKYIQTATNTKLCFLIPILAKSEEMIIHVIGEKILDRELRFSISNNILHKTIQNKKPTAIDMTMLDEELLYYLEPICSISNSFLTIPIVHPKQNYIALLVCLIDNDSTNEIICKCAIVQDCFRYIWIFFL